MKRLNPYRKKSRIGTAKTREIIKYFSMDFPSVKVAEITGLNRKTTDDWYTYIRKCIAEDCEKEKKEKLGGGVYELDESYF